MSNPSTPTSVTPNNMFPFPGEVSSASVGNLNEFSGMGMSTFSYSESLYQTLNNLVSLDSMLRNREEVMLHKDILTTVKEKTTTELELYGLNTADVKELEDINTNVVNGKSKLLACLKNYDECIDEMQQVETGIAVTKRTISQIEDHLSSLSRQHTEVKDIAEPFICQLTQKHQTIIEEMESRLGMLCIEKDRLEAVIKFLATTYGILKNAPLTHTCPICITHEVDTFLEPCGHTLCKECNRNSYCHMCRTKIKGARDIYFS